MVKATAGGSRKRPLVVMPFFRLLVKKSNFQNATKRPTVPKSAHSREFTVRNPEAQLIQRRFLVILGDFGGCIWCFLVVFCG